MRFGVSTWVWVSPLTDEALEKLVPEVADAGFDWIELPIETPGDFDYMHAAELVRRHGLGVGVCAVMSPGRDLIDPDVSVRRASADYVRHCVDAAQVLGAEHVVGPLYSSTGRVWQVSPEKREHDLLLLAEELRELAAYAAARQVVLCIEPLNRFETSLLNLASQGVDLVERVAHPGCQLMLDTFHMNIEERSLGAAVKAVGPRLRYLHVCENDRGAPGSGHVPWRELAAALQDLSYDGPLVIESFTPQVRSIARAASIWRPLASSQDALAREGLAFLRQLLT